MLTTNLLLLLALAGVATTMAQIMPLPNNITFVNNPIPGTTRSTSNSTSSQKDVIKADATSGRCGIHVLQSKCSESFAGIALRSVDWNGDIQYEGYCASTVCAWPLLGMVISWLVCSKGIRRASVLAGRVLSVRILGLILIRNQDVIWVLGRVAIGNLIAGMGVGSIVFQREAEGGKGRESGGKVRMLGRTSNALPRVQ